MVSLPSKVIGVILAFVMLVFAPLVILSLTANIRTERIVWNALTNYTDIVADRGKLTQKDFDTFMSRLGASMVNFDVTITVQRRQIIPSPTVPGGHEIIFTSAGLWRNVTGFASDVVLHAGDNVQVTLMPLSRTHSDNVLSNVVGIHQERSPIVFARNVRNTGGISF